MKRKYFIFLIAVSCISSLSITSLFGAEYFVKVTGVGAKNGSNWENAMGNDEFAASLINASSGDVYYLAAGTYYPKLNATGGRGDIYTKAFTLKPGVDIIGSFKADLTSKAKDYAEYSRDRIITSSNNELNPTTIFSGDTKDILGLVYNCHLVKAVNMKPDQPNTKHQPNIINGILFTESVHAGLIAEYADITIQYCKFSDITAWGKNSLYPLSAGLGGVLRSFNGSVTLEYSEVTDNEMFEGGKAQFEQLVALFG